MESYGDATSYLAAVEERSALPSGFSCGTASISFKAPELGSDKAFPMNLSAILLEQATDSFAAVLTRNRFAGAPVVLARRRLENSSARGVLINNKVSNVHAPGGVATAEGLLQELAQLVGAEPQQLFSASTGVIGWGLPAKEMTAALPELRDDLDATGLAEVAKAIMTTDAFPKLRSVQVGSGRVVGIAKGAGMIEPNMATLLVFIMTDLDIGREKLRRSLAAAVGYSFNRISIDGDQSTSDMVLAFSSRRCPLRSQEEFDDALAGVCSSLAADVVRNGEGTGHVIRVCVGEAADEATAVGIGKAIVNSPLVKTAVFGNDPNVGRIIMAIGDYAGNTGCRLDPGAVAISIGERLVFSEGVFRLDPETEREISSYMADASLDAEAKGYPAHDKTVDIDVSLGQGHARAEIIGSDLSYEYVRENAEYRT